MMKLARCSSSASGKAASKSSTYSMSWVRSRLLFFGYRAWVGSVGAGMGLWASGKAVCTPQAILQDETVDGGGAAPALTQQT